ncbi:MAG: biotin--[acetyl-CoA-carboxylase] ligase [Bdellovibrionia bacterium]
MKSDTSPLNDVRIGEVTSQWAKGNHLFVRYFKTLSSTNDLAKEEAFHEDLLAEALALYITDQQSQGRGRKEHTWTNAPVGAALYASWSYLTDAHPQPILSPLMGLALYRALSCTWPFLDWSMKAPNDIYLGSKKVAGILIENIVQGDETRIIIGVGLNVLAAPSSIEHATSIAESLPSGVPLLGEDYISFLDRFLFEITEALSKSEQALSPTDQLSLKKALNQWPLLEQPYVRIESDGTLFSESQSWHWSQL